MPYLVKSSKCAIPDLEPSDIKDSENIEDFPKALMKCEITIPLTQTETSLEFGSPLFLQIDDDALEAYPIDDAEKLQCCYKIIKRKDDDLNDVAEECVE